MVERSWEVGEEAMCKLGAGDAEGAWNLLGGWYRDISTCPPKRCHNSMEEQTIKQEWLYDKVQPPGDPIPCNMNTVVVKNDCPSVAECRDTVQLMNNGQAGDNVSGIRAEHMKKWLGTMHQEEKAAAEGTVKCRGAGDTWRLLIQLMGHIWETKEIPRQMLWVTKVLIPKGNSGDYRGIGLLKPIWKLIEKVLDTRLEKLECHDCLYSFLAGRWTGTASLEVKLVQQLAYLEQVPFYGNLIDLQKAYDAMY